MTESGRAAGAFVGRQREAAVLSQQLEAALGGQTRVVFLAGEPGIGKSRLLARAAEEGHAAGAIVLRGGVSPAEGMPPYLAFLLAIGHYVREADPAKVQSVAGEYAGTLAGLFPEIAMRLGDVPAPPSLPSDQARLRLFEAVGALLAGIAAPHGLVLCLDDLQWSDASTLDLLTAIAVQHPQERMLIVGAYRDAEADENRSLLRAVAELTRHRRSLRLPVAPLSLAEMGSLAATYLGGVMAPALLERLHTQSGGNPFFAEELIGGWLDSRSVRPGADGWELASEHGDLLPPSILAAVRERLSHLPSRTVELLRTAAIVGRTFSLALLASIESVAPGPRDDEAVEEALRPAVHARLLRPTEGDSCMFAHDTIRECLYAEVSSVRRSRLHGAIGRLLAAAPGREDTHRMAELAFHFARSGDVEAGFTYSIRAGDLALRAYAYEEAVAHFRTALDLLDPGDPRRSHVLLSTADAALLAGRAEEAALGFDLASRALRSGDLAAAARATHGLGVARWRQDRLDEARVALEAALALLAGAQDPHADTLTIRVLIDLATVMGVALGRQPEAMAYGSRALEAARRSGERRLEAIATCTTGKLLMRGNDFGAGITVLEEALVLAVAAGDPATAAECCANLANGYFAQGRIEHSRRATYQRLEHARRCQQPHEMRHVHGWLALLAMWQGRWDEAAAFIVQAEAVVQDLAGDEPRAYLYAMRGMLAYQRGCLDEAIEHLERTVVIHRAKGPAHLTWYAGLLMLAYEEHGDRRAALALRAELEAAVDALPPRIVPVAPALTLLVRFALARGEVGRAAAYGEGLRPFSGLMFSAFMVDSALGLLEAALGNRDAAETHLTQAEHIARANGLRPALADLLELRGGLMLQRADAESVRLARPLLDEAAHLYEHLGMTHRARPVRDRLQHLPQPERRRTALPAGLSRREAEVLRLVAAGKSNREIAQELFLSENTVANHITSIFNKTACENRAAATAFALRNGLA